MYHNIINNYDDKMFIHFCVLKIIGNLKNLETLETVGNINDHSKSVIEEKAKEMNIKYIIIDEISMVPEIFYKYFL